MNTSKPERSIEHDSPNAQPNQIELFKDEDRRITLKLDLLFGDAETSSAAKKLATAALHLMSKVWPRPSKTSEATRFRLINATCCRFFFTTARLGPLLIPCYAVLNSSIVDSCV